MTTHWLHQLPPPTVGADKYIEQIKQTTNSKYHQKPFHDSEKNDSTKVMASQDPWRSFVQGILRKQNNKIIIQVLEKILCSEFAKARQYLPTSTIPEQVKSQLGK
jgi:hypothetical protein